MRQRLIGDAPVVETAMRIPGGDAVHRAFVVHAGAGDVLVVEVENRSAVPFACALAVRPSNPLGAARVERVELEDSAPSGAVLMVNGRAGVLLPRPPARAAACAAAEGDVADAVIGGGAGDRLVPTSCPDGGVTAAVIYPVPHTAVLRVVLALVDAKSHSPGAPSRFPPHLPSAEQVASGWAAHSARGLSLGLPDPRLASEVDAGRRFLLLADGGGRLAGWPDPRAEPTRWGDVRGVIGALDRFGYTDEATELLAAIGREDSIDEVVDDHDGQILLALLDHWRLTRDRDLVEHLVPVIAAAVHVVDRSRGNRRALESASTLLDAVGQERAARTVSRRARRARHGPPGRDDADPRRPQGPTTLERATADLAAAGGAGRDPVAGASFLVAVRSALVQESGTDADPALVLSAGLPESWRGQGYEVQDAPTAYGRLSYAVRWHGARPALLWELEPHDALATPVALIAPGLDPAWLSREPRGEALLGPPPERAGDRPREQGASFS